MLLKMKSNSVCRIFVFRYQNKYIALKHTIMPDNPKKKKLDRKRESKQDWEKQYKRKKPLKGKPNS
jgi:hypothetical protein